jgi:hypothetical protein
MLGGKLVLCRYNILYVQTPREASLSVHSYNALRRHLMKMEGTFRSLRAVATVLEVYRFMQDGGLDMRAAERPLHLSFRCNSNEAEVARQRAQDHADEVKVRLS